MKVVAISDTHTLIPEHELPKGDVLVIAGDILGRGTFAELFKAKAWLLSIYTKYKYILFTMGNHDMCFENDYNTSKTILEEIPNLTVLFDEEAIIDGVKFYGTPWQPEFCDWAFNLPRGQELKEKWALIPDDVNVLITHGPPFGTLDYCDNGHVGCGMLSVRVGELTELKAHFFGHIHEGYGQDGIFYNVSICDENYRPINPPTVVEI